MARKRVVALGGEGIGVEVIEAACYVLENANFDLEINKPIHGEAALKLGKEIFPDETRDLCDKADAILFGPVTERARPISAYFRWAYDNYANVRPIKYYLGAKIPLRNPLNIDFILIREMSEGMYPAREGKLSLLSKILPNLEDNRVGKSIANYGEGGFAIRIISEKGTNRIARFACDLARKRKNDSHPGKLTCVTKDAQFRETCGLFKKVVEEKIKEYPELIYEHYAVDNMARVLVRYPQELDVVVTSNMFGDILSDEAAELAGGLGMAPSAYLGGKVPYFAPCHGSAPKYAGRNVVNPTAAILSAKLMLEYFEMYDEAKAIDKAVAAVYSEGNSLTYDQGGKDSTMGCAEAILRKIT